MGRGFALVFALVLGSPAVTACGGVSFGPGDSGPSGVTGGNETEAGSALVAETPPVPPYHYAPLTPGNAWAALYTDYFGAPQMLADGGFMGGRAACSGTPGNCHGDGDAAGAAGSMGYVCAGEPTDAGKDECYTSLTTNGFKLLTPGTPFMSDLLYVGVLRSTENPNGTMPLGPPAAYSSNTYVFTDEDIGRLSAWVDAGFPNN
jgi:hypothetical protein